MDISAHIVTVVNTFVAAHTGHVYVSDVMDACGVTKAELLAWHRAGLVQLVGADMPQVMDQKKLAASWIPYRSSRFATVQPVQRG